MTTDQAIKILEGAIKKPNTIDGYLGQALTMAINALKNQSEIIRCKDCKHYMQTDHIHHRGWCLWWNHFTAIERYCSERALRGKEE